MANYLSYSITQPTRYYIEEYAYNVIPAVITLTFDSPPSSDGADYYMVVKDSGDLNADEIYITSVYGKTLTITGNTAVLNMNVVYDDCVIYTYYQGTQLPFYLRVRIDPTYQSPGLWSGHFIRL